MRVKIIIPILSLSIAVMTGFLYFSVSKQESATKYRNYILVKATGTKYEYEFPFEKGTTIFDVNKVLNMGFVKEVHHIYRKNGNRWIEVGFSDKIEKDQVLKFT